ncbi:hydrogen-transporting ATP synthase [Wallemia mellicola CBS 633.66]|uniref:Hydrogen-transporting ATP synthase n=1 Tax=Wallemia mellicola (strain ATCC MYA-4683 / CBS 633.66) TaxID=671144 RepID=I4YJ96_WALMC|nr:hydrogen-transporting ATP synthase [Wallemia mellicola CBS 633.66]EIM24038.1 hydrogen-transporting ATP synthase [Wallemia mellicola CBS 633.66]|eukprot:XP_006955870.1 hydrogen-transporting ATP synthase [Wallemia mellicola CBS 633.66]
MLATIARRQALKDLVPPKIATPSAVSGSEAGARMSSVIDFYSKLPKGNATQKASGIKGKYFDGQNSSRTPLLATIGGLFLIGYTLDCELHLEHHKNNHH